MFFNLAVLINSFPFSIWYLFGGWIEKISCKIIDNLKIFNQYFFPIVCKLKKARTQKVFSFLSISQKHENTF